jgi:hypothetical protein
MVISTDLKVLYYRHKNRYEDQWNRTGDPDTNSHSYAHLILTKVSKTYDGEKTAFSTNVAGKSGYLPVEN